MSKDGGGWSAVCKSSELGEGATVVHEGVAVFRHKGSLYAVEDRCAHGRGSLSTGDIEDISPRDVVHGSLQTPQACVRCPKHKAKFGGGLLFSLESGSSLTTGPSEHHSSIYRVGAFTCKEEGGTVYVSAQARGEGALRLADKIKIRVHKAGRALGCVPMTGGSDDDGRMLVLQDWSIAVAERVGKNGMMLKLVGPPSNADETSGALKPGDLWHISVHAEVDGVAVERDYTPVSPLSEYHQGRLLLWIRVYPDGTLTPHLERLAGLAPLGREPVQARKSAVRVSRPALTLSFITDGDAALLLLSGGTGLAPILQALKSALEPPARFSSVLLVHSARFAADVPLLGAIREVLSRARVPVQVHFAVTGANGGAVRAPFPCGQSVGRVSPGLLSQLWGARRNAESICIVSGPQGMLDSMASVVPHTLGVRKDACHLLEA